MDNLPADYFVTSAAYTPTVYRDQYPSIDPTINPDLSQVGKVIIISGASSGLGARGFAPAFAKARPRAIVLVGRDMSTLKATEDALRDITTDVDYLPIPTDVSDVASVTALFRTVQARYGHADVLINNPDTSAFSPSTASPIGAADPVSWWSEFEVNLKGAFLLTRGFLSLLGPVPGPDRNRTRTRMRTASIVTVATTGLVSAPASASAAFLPPIMSSPSSSMAISNFAAWRLAEYVAAEYPYVTSVTLQPGLVLTEMVADEFKRFALDTPELVGGIGLWLTTDAATFLSGRFVSANWSVDDLMKRRNEIVARDELKMVYRGTFGLDQFK